MLLSLERMEIYSWLLFLGAGVTGTTLAHHQDVGHAFVDHLWSVVLAIFVAAQAGFTLPAIHRAQTVNGVVRQDRRESVGGEVHARIRGTGHSGRASVQTIAAVLSLAACDQN